LHLARIKNRSILWERLSLKAAREKMNFDQFVEMVLDEDQEFSEISEELESQDLTLKNSLIGFWMYGKWKLERG
jgi:hypothetical protein